MRPPANRRRAAAAPQTQPYATPAADASRGDHASLLHELEVHQVELEMQNEELRHAQVDLARARDRFADLYDFAPVGYLTLDARGLVLGANLTAAAMLGRDRTALAGLPFARYVAPGHADRWQQLLAQTLHSEDPQHIELALQRGDGAMLHAQVGSLRVAYTGEAPQLRISLTDVTKHKQADRDWRIAELAMEAREMERRTVARELHEGLGQRLTALKMELASQCAPEPAGSQAPRIAALLESLDEAIATVRRIAIGLRPLMLDDLGLNAAIEWLADDMARRFGVEIGVQLAVGKATLDERTSIAAYRLVQAMLGYAVQQPTATGARISMVQRSATLRLTVLCSCASRVRGTPVKAPAGATLSLHDQARLLGGRLEIDELAGYGTRITASLPLTRAAGATPEDPQSHMQEKP